VRPDTCPWRAISHPYSQAVIRAHRHWKVGELSALYPDGVPEALRFGIEVYDAALNAIQVADIRADRDRPPPERPPPRAAIDGPKKIPRALPAAKRPR
jgi:hypothetical protein